MVYANGLSKGGGMSFALSCTLSDRIAAVGMVGAALLLPFSWCTDLRPVPMIAFHGTADAAAPYTGGFSWVDRKSTRLNSSHSQISYAVFCLKKKKIHEPDSRRS